MSLLQTFYLFASIFVLLMMGFAESKGTTTIGGKWQHTRRSHCKKGDHKSLLVDQSGHGNFSTIQSAIDSIQPSNNEWICINIKAGIYREKVEIPYEKPYIALIGEGKKKTKIIWGDHATLSESPTFSSVADNIVVKHITFENSNNGTPMQAVAAMITGDKSSFYGCGFIGIQDTLWDDQGRHYFKKCSIEGSVDFIFGAGQSIYEKCVIHVRGLGFITAQGRDNPNDGNGFVFKECVVTGFGSAFLGRAWRGYARVLFYRSNFTNVINPLGWHPWNFTGQENQITFAEYENFGPGSASLERVTWEKRLDSNAVKQLTDLSFIDQEGWISSQP